MGIAALILAAGSSSRMGEGRHKLLLPLGERPVLVHVLTAALTSQARPLVLVLGHRAEQVLAAIRTYTTSPDLLVVENAAYPEGMSSSLKAGLRALIDGEQTEHTQSRPISGVIILLADQPLLTASIIDTLIETKRSSSKRIIAPLYNGRRGNPVLFDASLFPELMQVTGDEGGRSVIERHKQEIATVELGDAAAHYDVDTWEAYQQVVERWQKDH
ncbi:MAG: nucleotidyltransferase family protein [Ktedonobacteraceae bacterium]|nr:nucleotidyltransferase family protein [Ktedonobacteraceae bacterium]